MPVWYCCFVQGCYLCILQLLWFLFLTCTSLHCQYFCNKDVARKGSTVSVGAFAKQKFLKFPQAAWLSQNKNSIHIPEKAAGCPSDSLWPEVTEAHGSSWKLLMQALDRSPTRPKTEQSRLQSLAESWFNNSKHFNNSRHAFNCSANSYDSGWASGCKVFIVSFWAAAAGSSLALAASECNILLVVDIAINHWQPCKLRSQDLRKWHQEHRWAEVVLGKRNANGNIANTPHASPENLQADARAGSESCDMSLKFSAVWSRRFIWNSTFRQWPSPIRRIHVNNNDLSNLRLFSRDLSVL